ncbi:tetratricopeptide repeat-containing sensor histidine kinase [Winogradskyella algicola]|uniref:tetratricopeptide repeat-containing sensor histidine kinase n=1 Tax=Winogradskyella algicola TaxID=2575815 RepID=UPI001107F6A3|nr:histidine kinase dimerization/phosphoacceptor domain -containing protein [Winogradskyella algicola]
MKFFWIFLFIPFLSISQNNDLKDQLRDAIESTSNIEKKVQFHVDLAWEYIMEENDSALIYSNKAYDFSKLSNYPLGQAIAKETSGLYYEIVDGNYDRASSLYFDGIAICEENNLDYDSSIYHSLGVMFHTSDNYEKALEYYTISYDKAKEVDDLELQKKCLINLGTINSSLNNFLEAEELLLKSLDINTREELNFDTYANLGNLYIRQEKFRDALPFLEKATIQHPDNYNSEENLTYLINAKIALKDTLGMQPIIKRAKASLESTTALRNNSIMTMSLSNYYRSIGDFETALSYRDDYLKMYESIKEKQRDQTVYELETKYQTEKTKEALEKKEKEEQLYITLLVIGVIIASALAFLLYNNRKKKLQLARQKQLLEATIDEKNVLLKETHHRVKNSFQIVSSLLYLQSESVEDKEAKIAIKEAENRVRSMVLIHQKLYNKDELVGINTKDYFNDLVRDIFESHQFKSEPITYNLDIEPLVLDIETITPVGLILNELIVNTLKHAFDEVTSKSKIDIYFNKVEDHLELKVIDNGNGFEGEVKNTSFGITLMKALSKKLNASLNYMSKINEGTEAQLIIKKYNLL